jgi:hypothetical protein
MKSSNTSDKLAKQGFSKEEIKKIEKALNIKNYDQEIYILRDYNPSYVSLSLSEHKPIKLTFVSGNKNALLYTNDRKTVYYVVDCSSEIVDNCTYIVRKYDREKDGLHYLKTIGERFKTLNGFRSDVDAAFNLRESQVMGGMDSGMMMSRNDFGGGWDHPPMGGMDSGMMMSRNDFGGGWDHPPMVSNVSLYGIDFRLFQGALRKMGLNLMDNGRVRYIQDDCENYPYVIFKTLDSASLKYTSILEKIKNVLGSTIKESEFTSPFFSLDSENGRNKDLDVITGKIEYMKGDGDDNDVTIKPFEEGYYYDTSYSKSSSAMIDGRKSLRSMKKIQLCMCDIHTVKIDGVVYNGNFNARNVTDEEKSNSEFKFDYVEYEKGRYEPCIRTIIKTVEKKRKTVRKK